MGIETVEPEQRTKIIETLYTGLEDYAIDRRGDVGSWVRQQAMEALNTFIHAVVECEDLTVRKQLGADTAAFYERFICAYLQQLNEKIDRIREQAGCNLQKFFKFTVPKLSNINFSMKDELTALFIQEIDGVPVGMDGISHLPWRSAKFVF